MNERALKPQHTSGKKFVLGMGIVFLVMAVGLWFGLKGFVDYHNTHKPPEIPLRWSERDHWPISPVTHFDLEYDSMVQAETGKQYRKAEFALDKDEAEEKKIEAMLLGCATLVRGCDEESLQSEGVRALLNESATHFPNQFYPAYLLACAYPDDEARMAHAISLAPALLLEEGHRPSEVLPPIAISFDRLKTIPKKNPSFLERFVHHTQEQVLNCDLVLVYPTPKADAHGRLWLPVFRDMYRWANPAMAGAQPDKQWFSMPDGVRVGQLNGAGSNVPPRP